MLYRFDRVRKSYGPKEVLKDVTWQHNPGQKVGLVGRNGAGKTTLLSVLSRITRPTRGRAVLRGSCSALLSVGTGFHQELSGRDNVYLNGALVGMSRRYIRERFEELLRGQAHRGK